MPPAEGVARALNSGLVLLYWEIGRRIRQDILREKRAEYGAEIVQAVSAQLSEEFGRGFGHRNLFNMIRFAEVCPDPKIVHALSAQLGWTHDYGTDARDEVFRALHAELKRTPLWLLIRHGLKVRGLEFRLYYPKPRSSESVAVKLYDKNRITFRPHCYFGETNQEIDFVFFLNGLPIVALEVKHEKNQNVHDAVAQFGRRDHARRIFQGPFLYIAADTADVMVATDPRREENFRWHNSGLTNTPQTAGEYPVEFLYREVLSKERLLEALAFFLVYVPKRDAEADRPERPAFTLFPRYHQSRTVRKVADHVVGDFEATGEIGGKHLIHHSAGSGKTLSMCWLADRLHSLFKPGTSEKLVDMVFVVTDRRSLDKNIKDEVENFTHLKDVAGLARRAEDLPRFLAQRKSIVVTTQQKFAWILEEIRSDPRLKAMRVAFLLDEAHRSQEGRLGAAIRIPFRTPEEPDAEDVAEETQDEEVQIARIIREHDANQLFVAFTATPAPATVTLFGAAFDVYTEAEAILEGYIVDVALSVISYKTLYNLHCRVLPKPDEEKLYPKGVVAKALKTVAFQDDGLIQYKAEVKEHFICITINGANEVLQVHVISIGLVDRSHVHSREVFAEAIADRASAIIVAHNHPAGPLEPSSADLEATRQLKAAGDIIGIQLLDHIIFNRSGYFSFLESGTL